MSKDTVSGGGEPAQVMVAVTASAASTGSLRAMLRLLPAQPDAAVVLVLQHMEVFDEDSVRQAAAEGGHDPLWAADGMPAEPGRIYLTPPDMVVTIRAGRFAAEPTEQAPGLQGIIDSFLVSLARDQGNRAIAVALDGTDGDGTLGVREVKAAGGLVLAECVPEDLERSDGPAALADAVLPVHEIPPRLGALIEQTLSLRETVADEVETDAAGEMLDGIVALLRQRTGHDFHGYKRGTFLRRVQRRMQALMIDEPSAYVELLRNSGDEPQNLFNDLLIGVTEFFRDRKEWALLEEQVIPRLFEGKHRGEPLRAWIAGCSTGEEAYSLAILLAEYRARLEDPPPIQIFASDLDGRALAAGRSGRYPGSIAAQMSPERLGRWFVKEGDIYCVVKELREMCIFSQHSLIKDAPFSRLDLVSCRNLLIYLDAELQEKVIPLFHFALRTGGFLFLGNSENASRHQSLFAPVEPRSRVFRRLDTASRIFPDFPFTSVDRGWLARARPELPPGDGRGSGDLTRWAEHVMERHAPAFVVIDESYTVLHFSGPMGRYLAPASGAASLNLLQLTHPVLRAELRAALGRAAAEARAVELPGLVIASNGQRLRVDVTIEPRLSLPESHAGFVVIFKDCGVTPDRGPADEASGDQNDEHLRRLEEDLRLTRDRLQATIEELESTNEELKSSNEEYQSLNEELQSANEELETSKEELQSVNEELTTVNGELAHRVQELGRANSDLKNFLESTQIATLFLDSELKVTNFTPAIADIFHLVESDEGRPIEHIKARVGYEGLAEDARRVLRTLAPAEREVDNPDTGARYIARVLPYRSTDNFIAGVVVTFVDVTARREAEERLRQSEERNAFLVRFSDAVRGLSDPAAIQEASCLLLSEQLGTERTLWAAVDWSAREYVVECMVEGEGRVANPARLPFDPGQSFAAEYLAGRSVAYGDIATDSRVPDAARSVMIALGNRSGIAVPVIVGGTLRAVLNTSQRSTLRSWRLDEIAFVEALAGRAWAEVERARAEARLRASESRQAFLLQLSDALRPLSGAAEIQGEATRLLAGHLDVDRACYVEVDEEAGTARTERDHVRGEGASLAGERRIADFGWPVEILRRGESHMVADSRVSALVPEAERPVSVALGIIACMGAPLIEEGRLVGALCVASREPRDWTAHEAATLREAAERICAAIGRARAEARLRQTEARLMAFGQASSDLLWIRNAETLAFEYLSPAFERIFGVARDKVLEGDTLRNWMDMILPEDRARATLERVRQGERLAFEYRIACPDNGQVRLLRDTVFPVRDLDARLSWIAGVTHDATEEAASAERLAVLVAELQHRTRNLLGVVGSVMARTLNSSRSLKDFSARMGERLEALARVNGLLSRLEEDDRIDFDELIRSELDAHGVLDGGKGPQISLRGPRRIRLRSSTVQTLALGLHELATNALKHGALSQPDGRLDIRWSMVPGADGPSRLRVEWRESGIPVDLDGDGASTRPKGYGRELIEQALPYQLSAEVDYDLSSQGVRCTITIPVSTSMEGVQVPG